MQNSLAVFLVVSLALTSACTFDYIPAETFPRETLPLPEEIARKFEVPELGLADAEIQRLETTSAYRKFSFEIPGHDLDVKGELYQSLTGEALRKPLVIIHPILSGRYLLSRILSRWLCEEGFHALIVFREGNIMDLGVDVESWEETTVLAIRKMRAAAHVASKLDFVDENRIGAIGVSLGAIRGTIFAAVEPIVKAHVLCMPGDNVANIVSVSTEKRVRRFRENYLETRGIDVAEFHRRIDGSFTLNPGDYAKYVERERVMMVLALHDETVPVNEGFSLYDKIGHPELVAIPSGHYSAALFLPKIFPEMVRALRERLNINAEEIEPR
ncbi:MAG: hypothetical protein NUW37_00465 [Planctomycetes bacterium]|nr:hypothetical protein [Planctomycetota bacterium]